MNNVCVLCDSQELLSKGTYSDKHTMSNFVTVSPCANLDGMPFCIPLLFLGCLPGQYIVSVLYSGS